MINVLKLHDLRWGIKGDVIMEDVFKNYLHHYGLIKVNMIILGILK